MKIETERLELIPLTQHQLKLWIEDMPSLEKEMNCVYKAEPMQGIFLQIVQGQLVAVQKDNENYMWHSFWFLVRKSDRTVVGAADFKDIPDKNKEVEIGYGLGSEFEHNGYMTEAVKAMCDWALAQKDVLHIVAQTDSDGFASQRILQRCGFKKQTDGEAPWWKL